jgi:ABC-type protease/lipase transport system fused ATPase/permease subunit
MSVTDNTVSTLPCPPKAKQPALFAQEVDRQKVRKARKRDEVARLISEERMTHAEVAEVMGISERWVYQLWSEAKTAALRGDLSSEEVRGWTESPVCPCRLPSTLAGGTF